MSSTSSLFQQRNEKKPSWPYKKEQTRATHDQDEVASMAILVTKCFYASPNTCSRLFCFISLVMDF